MQDFGSGVGFSTTNNVYANEELKKSMLTKELKNYFSPEFLNRLDEVVVFNTLQNDDVEKIVSVEINKLKNRLVELGYDIEFDESSIKYISKIGFDEVYGARPLKRAIQEKFEDFISDEVLKETILVGKKYTISINESEEVSYTEVPEVVKKGRKKKGE
jgi:ATP-dependent Clp protease ATP-binding subunit ClpC